jgi:hypothetical protein
MDAARQKRATGAGRWSRYLASAASGSFLALALFAPGAAASLGYEPASPATIAVQGEGPQGVAIDQGTQNIYVAIPFKHFAFNPDQIEFGQIEQLNSSGTPTAASPFKAGSENLFTGVAVNPVTHGVYAAEIFAETPIGVLGTARIDQFSASGTLGTQFASGTHSEESARIAADSAGDVFVPNAAAENVRMYSSAGSLLETISCGGCPGGALKEPASVALDSEDNLYVVDVASGGRVIKFTHPGGHYAYSSVLQSGKGAAAVAVDPSLGTVFVGDYPAGGYHIVAYDSSGTQFDDFGGDLFAGSHSGARGAGQIAVNATTHRLYASDPGANLLRVFERVTINPPTVTTETATPVGQIEATVRATVNANFHATSDCHFEYVDDDAFMANGYTGASQANCSLLPDGSKNTVVVATLSSLAPTTTYHYRAVATNNAGSVVGGSQSFTTLPVTQATVTTEPASGITIAAAKLNGKVNPHGGTVTSCRIEYGLTQLYGSNVSCPTKVGPVSTTVSQSASVSGLQSSTIYHYRLAVTTNAGSVNGDDREFTTLSPPPPEEEPPAEPTNPGPPPLLTPSTLTPPATVNPHKKLVCRKGFRKRRVHGRLRCVRKPRKHRPR